MLIHVNPNVMFVISGLEVARDLCAIEFFQVGGASWQGSCEAQCHEADEGAGEMHFGWFCRLLFVSFELLDEEREDDEDSNIDILSLCNLI